MLDESLSVDCRRHDGSEAKKNIAELWAEFCNLDPEHFIWGTEPNETPPEVVIKRVVFAPKKSTAQEDEEKGKKTKRSKGNKEPAPQEQRGRERNKSCIVM